MKQYKVIKYGNKPQLLITPLDHLNNRNYKVATINVKFLILKAIWTIIWKEKGTTHTLLIWARTGRFPGRNILAIWEAAVLVLVLLFFVRMIVGV